ncbi:MAG: succinate dehydrogenase cytochrome b subunit [Myxococcota bacterium]
MVQTRQALIQNTVGKKIIMAVTGALMVIFVIAHMVGNTLVFQGAKAINDYGWLLQEGTHGAVWGLRAVMLAAVVLHVWAMVGIVGSQQSARSSRYQYTRKNQATNYAAITMKFGGPVLLLFIVYHLLHFTTGHVHSDFIRGDVYHNLVTGLSNPLLAGVYLVAQAALGLHLYHGIASGLQTLGLPLRYDRLRRAGALATALIVVGGNTAIVTYVQLIHLGIVQELP